MPRYGPSEKGLMSCAGLLIGYDESNVFEIHYLVYPQPLGMLYSCAMVIMKAITVQGGKTGTRTW